MLSTLAALRRIVPLLGICLIPVHAGAVETLRIAMEEPGGAAEVSGKSLSLGPDDEEADFKPLDSTRARVRAVDGRLEINGVAWEQDAVRFRLGGDDPDLAIRVGGFRIRGDLVIRLRSARLQLINVLPLEEYLVGVVGAEMPPAFPLEALKAQAVAARTYALRKKLDAADASTHLGTGVLHQVYRGLSRHDEKVRQAVEATRGEILTFDLEPIEAYFHASCGGRTESGQAALGRDLPYLQPVACPCEKLALNKWELSVSGTDLKALFGIPEGSSLGIAARSGTGRVRTLSLGSNRFLDAVELRQKLGYDRLKSLWFGLERGNAGGIKLSGKGHGHGAGMCQWGARAYAAQGRGYREILLHYYPGVEVQQLY